MSYFCEKCKKLHSDDELCQYIKIEIQKNPNLLSEASNFVNIASQYKLISSQDLQNIANQINNLVGTNLSYEGTHQFARDIQVFNRLNTETYVRSGHFRTTENAIEYLEKKAMNSENLMKNLNGKLTGSSQEIDWLRFKQGQLSSIIEKSELLNKNYPGVDGETINRITGKTISRTTVKATTIDPIQNVKSIKDSIKKGYTTKNDIIFGIEGTKDSAKKIGLSNKVIEKNTMEQVKESNERLKNKILNGQATTTITGQQLMQKMAQGAIIGAAVSLTISSITNYIRYKNGEITLNDAFRDVAEDTVKGTIIGAGMSGLTLFLPAGPIGWVCGVVIGIYLSATLTNILDEVFGKGAYYQIFLSTGYVMGTATNLSEILAKISSNVGEIDKSNKNSLKSIEQTKKSLDEFDKIMEDI